MGHQSTPLYLYIQNIKLVCQSDTPCTGLDRENLVYRSNVNSVVHGYLSPTPVGVGVGTSLIWAVDQTLLPARVWLRETRTGLGKSSLPPTEY